MAGEEMINLTRLGDFHANMTVDAHILKRSTAYAVDKIVNKGFVYLKCTQAGTTASTALSLSGVSVGDELTDGTAKWEVISVNGVPEGGGGTGSGLEDWQAEHEYAENDICVYEGQIYRAKVGYTSDITFSTTQILEEYEPVGGETIIPYAQGTEISINDIVSYDNNTYKALYNFVCGEEFSLYALEEYVPHELTEEEIRNIIRNFNPEYHAIYASSGNPVGTILHFMGIIPPTDYLACDGTIYNIDDYPLLATHINIQFGRYDYFGGDGTTTFAVPDLRGEFLRGTGINSHSNQGSGASVGVHQDSSAIPMYYLNNNTKQLTVYSSQDASTHAKMINSDSTIAMESYWQLVTAFSHNASTTGNGHQTIRPTNTSVLYCIKYK